MPIYEYTCPDCGNEFETIQKVSEPRLTDCPSCERTNLRKKVSATNFALKGSGWYKDHYGLKPGGSSDSGGPSGGGSSAGTSSGASDTPSSSTGASDSAPAPAPAAASTPTAAPSAKPAASSE